MCAYGLSSGLKKIKGVSDVTVSLNRGMAEIKLVPGNRVTIQQIRNLVRRNGFTPKEARVKVVGITRKSAADLVLVLEKGQEYRLTPSAEHEQSKAELGQLKVGEQVVIEGLVPADLTKQPVLEVYKVSMRAVRLEEEEAK